MTVMIKMRRRREEKLKRREEYEANENGLSIDINVWITFFLLPFDSSNLGRTVFNTVKIIRSRLPLSEIVNPRAVDKSYRRRGCSHRAHDLSIEIKKRRGDPFCCICLRLLLLLLLFVFFLLFFNYVEAEDDGLRRHSGCSSKVGSS